MFDPYIVADVPARRMLAPIAFALVFAFGAPAVAANTFFAVVPVSAAGTPGQMRPVKIALASATPPAAHVGEPYEFNLGALLSLDGPEGTEPGKVSWSVVSGELPAGLSLVGDLVVGVPTELVPSRQVIIQAEYVSAQGTVGAMASYSFEIAGIPIASFGGYRAWEDGTYAQSCEGYIRSGDVLHPYTGAIGSGVYRIAPGNTPLDVFCDQTTDNGGWTLLMKQAAGDGTTLQGDSDYWKNGTVLNDTVGGRGMADGNFVSPAFARVPVEAFRLQAANEQTMRYHQNTSRLAALTAFSDAQRITYFDPYGVWAPSAPNWFIHTGTYPNGAPITTARFAFNFYETGGGCQARWGWAANENLAGAMGDGTSHDTCGGLGAYGSQYGLSWMNNDKGAWNAVTLYLWGR